MSSYTPNWLDGCSRLIYDDLREWPQLALILYTAGKPIEKREQLMIYRLMPPVSKTTQKCPFQLFTDHSSPVRLPVSQ